MLRHLQRKGIRHLSVLSVAGDPLPKLPLARRFLAGQGLRPEAGRHKVSAPMIDDDLHTLRDLLREAISSLRLTNREAESAMGIAHGSLEGLLQGKLDLRVRHLLALAEILKVSPADFLALGCPTAEDAARHDLVEWLSPPARGRMKAAPTPVSSDLADLVRKTIREELARARRGPNGPEDPES